MFVVNKEEVLKNAVHSKYVATATKPTNHSTCGLRCVNPTRRATWGYRSPSKLQCDIKDSVFFSRLGAGPNYPLAWFLITPLHRRYLTLVGPFTTQFGQIWGGVTMAYCFGLFNWKWKLTHRLKLKCLQQKMMFRMWSALFICSSAAGVVKLGHHWIYCETEPAAAAALHEEAISKL